MAGSRYTSKDLEDDIADYNAIMKDNDCDRRYMIGGAYGHTYVYKRTRAQHEDNRGSIVGTVESGTPRECFVAMVRDAGWELAETRKKKMAALEARIAKLEAERG